MRPVKLTAPASTGPSAPCVLDQYLTPTNVALAVEFGTAVATSKVQYSPDDPFAVYATDYNTNANWYDHPTLTGLTTDAQDNFAVPMRALRLNNTAWTSGQPTLTIIQAGIR